MLFSVYIEDLFEIEADSAEDAKAQVEDIVRRDGVTVIAELAVELRTE